jgi:hypothetical protein
MAKSNGGVPIGRARFERETGIKESDWAGRFWVRWSEAVKEAGFEPNKLNIAHEKEFLLEQYASLIRELGRIPVQGEVIMKRRTDPDFPSAKTFERFGNKAQVLAKVAEYCRAKGYDDIVAIYEATTATRKRRIPTMKKTMKLFLASSISSNPDATSRLVGQTQ